MQEEITRHLLQGPKGWILYGSGEITVHLHSLTCLIIFVRSLSKNAHILMNHHKHFYASGMGWIVSQWSVPVQVLQVCTLTFSRPELATMPVLFTGFLPHTS